MKRKKALWLSLVLSVSLAGIAVNANAIQQKDAPTSQTAPHTPQEANVALKVKDPDKWNAQRTIAGPYRLTYTLTEMDGSRRVGSQHYSIVLDSGEEVPSTQLRLGTKVPLETGEFKAGSGAQTQISYIDVGLMIDVSLRSFANGHELRSHIVQSAVDAQQSLTMDPVVRQSDFKNTVLLNENKPVTIGNVDMPGTTHILQIQVELTKLP